MKKFEYFKPQSLEEAYELLVEYGDKAHILNGGTDLIVRMREGLVQPEVVVDIKGIEGLEEISYKEEDGLTIGACTTLNDLSSNPIVQEKFILLGQAAHTVGSLQVRNRATMVGNICNASPLADTATPLLALDAMVIIHGKEGLREVSIHDFFVWVRETCLKHGEIVTGVRVPIFKKVVFADYQKLSRRKEVDLSTVCASIVKIDGEYKIALGAVAPTPIRLRATEAYLRHKELEDEIIEEAQEIAMSEVSPITDIRASKEYRLEMVKVLVGRGLKDIREK